MLDDSSSGQRLHQVYPPERFGAGRGLSAGLLALLCCSRCCPRNGFPGVDTAPTHATTFCHRESGNFGDRRVEAEGIGDGLDLRLDPASHLHHAVHDFIASFTFGQRNATSAQSLVRKTRDTRLDRSIYGSKNEGKIKLSTSRLEKGCLGSI